jgi:hypothetical protein
VHGTMSALCELEIKSVDDEIDRLTPARLTMDVNPRRIAEWR